MKKIFLLMLAVVLCFAGSAQAAQLNKVAAVVNGQVITMFDLQKAAMSELARHRLDPDNPAQAAAVNKVFRKVLDVMVIDILIKQEAKRLSVSVGPADVDEEISRMMRERKLSKKQFEAQLARQNIKLADFRDNIEINLLRQRIMAMQVSRKVVVTPEEIKAYYEANKEKMLDRSGLHWGLLVYHPNAPAKKLAAQITSGKLSFAEAVRKYSIGPNKDKGGDMGPFDPSKLNPEWAEKLMNMKTGSVGPLFSLPPQNGHVFKAQLQLFRPGGGEDKQLTLEEATPRIDRILRQPKSAERFEDYTKALKEKAVIDIRL